MEHVNDHNINCIWFARLSPLMIVLGNGVLGNKKTIGEHPNYNIFEIGQKCPGDLKRLAVIETPVKNHLLMLVGKISNE